MSGSLCYRKSCPKKVWPHSKYTSLYALRYGQNNLNFLKPPKGS